MVARETAAACGMDVEEIEVPWKKVCPAPGVAAAWQMRPASDAQVRPRTGSGASAPQGETGRGGRLHGALSPGSATPRRALGRGVSTLVPQAEQAASALAVVHTVPVHVGVLRTAVLLLEETGRTSDGGTVKATAAMRVVMLRTATEQDTRRHQTADDVLAACLRFSPVGAVIAGMAGTAADAPEEGLRPLDLPAGSGLLTGEKRSMPALGPPPRCLPGHTDRCRPHCLVHRPVASRIGGGCCGRGPATRFRGCDGEERLRMTFYRIRCGVRLVQCARVLRRYPLEFHTRVVKKSVLHAEYADVYTLRISTRGESGAATMLAINAAGRRRWPGAWRTARGSRVISLSAAYWWSQATAPCCSSTRRTGRSRPGGAPRPAPNVSRERNRQGSTRGTGSSPSRGTGDDRWSTTTPPGGPPPRGPGAIDVSHWPVR